MKMNLNLDPTLLRDGTYQARLDDDGLLRIEPHEATSGYYVGQFPLPDDGHMPAGEDHLLGIWTDPSDNHIDVDVVLWAATIEEAVPLARAANQKAIWSITASECIWLRYEGDAALVCLGPTPDGLYMEVVGTNS